MKKYFFFLLFIFSLFTSHYSFSQWAYQDNPYFNSELLFRSVHFVDNNNGWAVGGFGSIVKYDGENWIYQNSNSYDYFESVFFTDKNNGWAVGHSINPPVGTILRYKNNKWIPQPKLYDYYYSSVYFTDSSNGWILGNKNDNEDSLIFLHYNNNKWTPTKLFSRYGLFSMCFTDANHGWAVGGGDQIIFNQDSSAFDIIEHYLILKYNGKQWAVQDSGIASSYLLSVCVPDTNHGWAVGVDGIIMKYDGKHWTPQASPNKMSLYSVYFKDSTHGWAVGGYNGQNVILKYDGIKWAKQNMTKDYGYTSVFFLDINNGWAVGAYGTIIHTTNGGETVSSNDLTNINDKLSTNIFPNPVNEEAVLNYQLQTNCFVSLKIYDLIGHEVSTPINEYKNKAEYNFSFNTKNLKPGIYFYTLSANDKTITKKFIKLN